MVYQRMVKKLLQTKNVSLALGSGSSKGIAHLGVIKYLLENKYNIEAISGTSIGSVVAAYYALGKLDIFSEWMLSFNKLDTYRKLDFSLSGGFINGKKFMATLEEHLGNPTFADTSIPLYISATNLNRGTEVVFSKGGILDAIRASISVPGVVKPHFYGGEYYVDGAVSNPVPVDILVENNHRNIIAVHLHEYIEPLDSAPSFIVTMARSMELVSKFLAKAKMRGAKVIIAPKVDDYSMFDLHKAHEIFEKGYDMTKKEMDNYTFTRFSLGEIGKGVFSAFSKK